MARFSATLILLLMPLPAAAQPLPADAWLVERINSRELGPRTIYVATPPGYARTETRYPLLIALDANDLPQFRLWIAQAAYLAANSPGLPPMIIVGIVNGSDRIYDMTPTPTGSSAKDFKTAGGATAFAQFLVSEIVPHVRANYRALPTTILAGHSAGGLFALDVAARMPNALQGIIAMSPALWFNDGALVDTYADLLARAAAPPRVFLASGVADEPDVEQPTKRLADRLEQFNGRSDRSTYRPYPDATHSLSPLAFSDGLRFVFDPVSHRHLAVEKLDPSTSDAASVKAAIEASEREYAAGAASLRLPERLPERALDRLGNRLLERKKTDLAVGVFERNLRSYPESMTAHDSLAQALIAKGDNAAALARLRVAADIARRSGATLPAAMQKKLEELQHLQEFRR